jgi:excisionase family DNA binding protein
MAMILASTKDRQMLAATPAELHQAREVVDLLGTPANNKVGLTTPHHEDVVVVPEELSGIMARILRIVASGGTVTIGSMPEELTTSTAAEQLGISRPTLMKMIDRGEIHAHKVGSHTRLRTSDVLAFRIERQARRRKAFEELRAQEDG